MCVAKKIDKKIDGPAVVCPALLASCFEDIGASELEVYIHAYMCMRVCVAKSIDTRIDR